MALKDTWVNKVDGVDVSSANDINEVAQAVIDLEEESRSIPDFAANEGEEGFIKNRTHYIDKEGNVHKLPIEFIPEGVAKEEYVDDSVRALFVPRRLSEMVSDKYHRTVEDDEKEKWNDGIIEEWEITQNYTASSTVVISEQTISNGLWSKRQMDIQLEIPYAVYINGTVYFCIAGEEDGGYYLGNPTLFYSASTQPHNNEPFCIYCAGGTATAGFFYKDDTLSYPLTLKVTRATVTTEKKIPEKYLPDGVGGGGADIDVVAEVGQTIVVEEVDADGKPTKWRAVDMGYHYFDIVDLLPEQTLPEAGISGPNIVTAGIPLLGLIEGETYTYTFDGVTYTSVATKFENLHWGGKTISGVMIGNFGMLDALFGTTYGDNGQPVIFLDSPSDGGCAYVPAVLGVYTVSINGKKETVKKLDPYIVPYAYYIDVEYQTTTSGTDDEIYICHDTVENVMAIIRSGREVKARVRTTGDNDMPISFEYSRHIYVESDGVVLLGFFSANLYAGLGVQLLFLSSQEDGTFAVSDNIGD